MAETVTRPRTDDATCPDHGNTLQYHEDQGGEWGELEWREHLECSVPGCEYEVWA